MICVMSSAYIMSVLSLYTVGWRGAMYMLYKVGERIAPCGTPSCRLN